MIEMVKTRWSRHLVKAIHNMSFQPKEAWANIKLLCKGEKSRHSSPQTIQIRMTSGELATKDEENVWVFADHFGKVLNNIKPTDTRVINSINLHEAMQELDLHPEWVEFIIAVVKLTKKKAPGLNGVPSNAFKVMTADNLFHLFDFILEFWEDRLDFVEWHEGQVVPVPKSVDLE